MSADGRLSSDMSMVELFRIEVEQQVALLTEGLLALEKESNADEHLTSLMRAAHSIKGAARLVDRPAVVELAHLVEEFFVGSQVGGYTLEADKVDVLFEAVDLIMRMAKESETDSQWLRQHKIQFEGVLQALQDFLGGSNVALPDRDGDEKEAVQVGVMLHDTVKGMPQQDQRTLRISALQLDKLMALTGEFMAHTRWLRPYVEALRRLKREQWSLVSGMEELKELLRAEAASEGVIQRFSTIQQHAAVSRDMIEERVGELEAFDVRAESLSSRLRAQVIASRMRPIRDGVQGLPRIVRDVARSLGKDVELDMEGLDTRVDRDILERIEAPLSHLLNNALDHGLETAAERIKSGKPETGRIEFAAYHNGGMLYITLIDDGRGIDFDDLRRKIIDKGLVRKDVAEHFTDQELTEFLFLPGFTTKAEVTPLSGRGVGLDVVRDVVQEMRGSVEVSSIKGQGTQFKLRLPLTLSVVPALLVEINGEPYGFPLARIYTTARLAVTDVIEHNGSQIVMLDGEEIDLVSAAQVLGLDERPSSSRLVSILVLGERDGRFGFVVERLLVESELVVQALPSQLGRIQDIGGAALLEDGSPVLIIDVDDILTSAKKFVGTRGQARFTTESETAETKKNKRVLVVDDSITVREIERKLLVGAGYDVEVAIDGIDGWNAVRNSVFDLVITDVDMPRLNGLQLVSMIKQDPALGTTPVMIVSYKDRHEDQERARNSGADFFLAKANFHDEALREAVAKLIGS